MTHALTPRLTIDSNCLLTLEEKTNPAAVQLLRLHENDQVVIHVPMISASELLRGGDYANTSSGFEERMRSVCARPLVPLLPIGRWNVTYYDKCVYGSDELVALERKIHSILFPQSAFDWREHAKSCGLDPEEALKGRNPSYLRWRNRLCDTASMWCHIYYECDHFVTDDSNFHKVSKKGRLIDLGAKGIVRLNQIPLLFPAR